MYQNIDGLLKSAQEAGTPLWKVVLKNEAELTEKTEEEIFQRLEKTYQVMERSAQKALSIPQPSIGGLITGISSTQNQYANMQDSLCGPWLNRTMAMAFSCSEVNASMGKICAAPTAGACGILPAVLISVREKQKLSLRETLCGLLTASGIGAVVMHNATVAGAEGGCQAECGVAAAMAAAAAVELCGGSPEAAAHASAFCLMNAMGLVCDPVAGLVQVPCAQRNGSQAMNALLSADWALAGLRCVIPPDEVVGAMYQTGKMLPVQLRETAQGGLAATPTAKSIFENIFIKD
ncbi:L-serine ammonia-lyase, iron-sulfur-dependent, subunit alpha [Clostridium minihomine]|uniref:L-serine ammonia-lyase, iron-sulfur-dependent, subunit alpha n=1 Tax=Clostridium minihomine TaxID=2045012 RepID=UPI000C7658E1|nr:L-serine ammonia-lyase, iron-sulfur-dependent, subunit alpha [Clostridium minihomine]